MTGKQSPPIGAEPIGHEKQFIALFQKLCTHRSAWQVWADFIAAAALSIANALDKNEVREKEYAECIARIGTEDVASELFSIVVQALEENPRQDFLGTMYMNLELGSHWKGQFFTPYNICELMAAIGIKGKSEEIKAKGWTSVNDCACGAGATLIAGKMSRRYAPEIHAFLREFIPGHTAAEIAAAVNEKFDIEMSLTAANSYRKNHGIRSGTPCGRRSGVPTKAFPAEARDYILARYIGTGHKDMADQLNVRFGTSYTPQKIKSFYANHKLNSGLTGRFEKGHVPANKGMKDPPGSMHPNSIATRFKPGHLPHNTKPVGYLSMRSNGYLYRKIAENPDVWKMEHIRRWEELHGPIPKGSRVIFLDGDRLNCEPVNLALVSAEENLEMNRGRLRSESGEITLSGVMIARARVSIRRAIRRRTPPTGAAQTKQPTP